MSRWHKSSCNSPRIFFDHSLTPECKTCGASAEDCLEALENKGPYLSPKPPSNEPLSHLNLSWPSSVPWTLVEDDIEIKTTSEGKSSISQTISQTGGSSGAKSILSTEVHQTTKAKPSHVYTNTLGVDEFRLVCLGARRADVPPTIVHLSLESHEDEHYPDYETVSYSWGGEDGDSNPYVPVSTKYSLDRKSSP